MSRTSSEGLMYVQFTSCVYWVMDGFNVNPLNYESNSRLAFASFYFDVFLIFPAKYHQSNQTVVKQNNNQIQFIIAPLEILLQIARSFSSSSIMLYFGKPNNTYYGLVGKAFSYLSRRPRFKTHQIAPRLIVSLSFFQSIK